MAQAIKSAQSQRWKMLLSFSCRNRLLLTGTPVQNTMQELWALLHFIMPTLFDSHEQFSQWFSKGVEGSVMDGQALNEHQLQRLHQVLKPFMLRRVKSDVESQMANKTEEVVECELSSRQVRFSNGWYSRTIHCLHCICGATRRKRCTKPYGMKYRWRASFRAKPWALNPAR